MGVSTPIIIAKETKTEDLKPVVGFDVDVAHGFGTRRLRGTAFLLCNITLVALAREKNIADGCRECLGRVASPRTRGQETRRG